MQCIRHVTVLLVAVFVWAALPSRAQQQPAPAATGDTMSRALMRIAEYIPSAADLADPANAGQAAGPRPADSGRRIVLRGRHGLPLRTGIAARVVDGNGNAVPYARVAVRVTNVSALRSDVPLPPGRTTANDPDVGGALNVDWLTGVTSSADPDGYLNVTEFTVTWCGAAETLLVLRVCPLASTEADTAKSHLVCGEAVTLVLLPDPSIVRLKFASDAARATGRPTAIGGALFNTFRVELRSSCDTSLTLATAGNAPSPTTTTAAITNSTTSTGLAATNAPGSTTVPPTPSPTMDPDEVGVVRLSGIGLTGLLEQPVLNNGTGAAATFAFARAVILPGAETVSRAEVAPASVIRVNATFIGAPWATPAEATVPLLTATTELSATIEPAATSALPGAEAPSVAVSAQLIRLDGALRYNVESMLLAYELASRDSSTGGLGTPSGNGASALQAAAGIAVTSMPELAPERVAELARPFGRYEVEMNLIRKYEGAVFAFVFNASVFASRASWRDVEAPVEGQMPAGNFTLFCSAEFDIANAPRGLTFGLTQPDLIIAMPRFAVASYDPVARRTTQQFVLPFRIGPYRPLSSTLTETLTCELNPGLLGRGYAMRAPRLMLEVSGLPDKDIGTARRFLSAFAILNPEIAYMCVLIQVCDCTIDHGLPLDMGLHPLQFGIGENQLTRYFIGALAGNFILMALSIVLSFAAAAFMRRRAADMLIRENAPSSTAAARMENAAANHRARKRQQELRERANRIFPHVPLMVIIALYPGTTYAAYGLLPRLSNTFVLLMWAVVGIVFAGVVPFAVVRIAVKVSPEFKPLDVHAITRGWHWKVLIPLGDYDGEHADLVRWRYAYDHFRGDYRWFFGVQMASWLVMSIFGANFVACTSRFLLPLVVQIAFFFMLVARAPFITAYQNVVAVGHSVMICIGLAFLFWDGQERRSNTFLSSWTITLVLLSIAMTAVRNVYAYYNEHYVIGAARGHLDEEFLMIEEDEDAKERRNHAYDPTGKVRIDDPMGLGDRNNHQQSATAKTRGGADAVGNEDGDEFVDAAREAAEGDGLRVKVVDIHKRDHESAFADFFDEAQGDGPGGGRRAITRGRNDPIGDLLDQILDGPPQRQYADADAVSQREFETQTYVDNEKGKKRNPAMNRDSGGMTFEEFEDWIDTMNKRERAEAERAALLQLRTGREERYVADQPLKSLSMEERHRMMVSPEQLRRLKENEEDERIDAYFRRRSRPTAGPTYEYGRRFAPDKTFAYQRRLEELSTRRRKYRGHIDPNDADDGLDGEDATAVVDATHDMVRNEKRRIKEELRQPVMPPRKLAPALEAARRRALDAAAKREAASEDRGSEERRERGASGPLRPLVKRVTPRESRQL